MTRTYGVYSDLKVYLADLIIGAFAFDEKGNRIDYELAPRDMDNAVDQAMKIESGEVYGSLARLLERLKDKKPTIVVEDDYLARSISKMDFEAKVEPGNNIALKARENLFKLALETGFSSSEEEFAQWLFEAELEYTRRKLRSAAQKRDLLAAQAIRAIDDIDKTVNLYVARLREWYSIHFPELNDLVKEHEDYVKIVAALGHRSNMTKKSLMDLGFSEEKAEKIAEAAKASIGADLSEFDVEAVQTLARIVSELYTLRRQLTEYIEQVMKEVAPNITALVGPLLGARLISLAGGLEKLARLPASTIQVLGAEKALFRALRTGGRPPKHGIIFQYPDIHRSPRWQRGKIARALAAKLAIAAKVDAFSGRFIGDKLREELRKRIEEIKKVYAKPPKRKPEPSKPAVGAGKPPKKGRGRRPPKKGRRGRGRARR
ncbi:MAG: C/D box methylation guide ribonucleoprotein complex aNOP56 subunit [Desulfurococcales archaeon]|nr:C/D box methylation guide ribonucleoprotein complex aNOP56 subunit [Desulfurococcales archaeon]